MPNHRHQDQASNTYAQTQTSTHLRKHKHTHTLDKNGSLYDPAGTESCDMQIRLVSYLDKNKISLQTRVELFPRVKRSWVFMGYG